MDKKWTASTTWKSEIMAIYMNEHLEYYEYQHLILTAFKKELYSISYGPNIVVKVSNNQLHT